MLRSIDLPDARRAAARLRGHLHRSPRVRLRAAGGQRHAGGRHAQRAEGSAGAHHLPSLTRPCSYIEHAGAALTAPALCRNNTRSIHERLTPDQRVLRQFPGFSVSHGAVAPLPDPPPRHLPRSLSPRRPRRHRHRRARSPGQPVRQHPRLRRRLGRGVRPPRGAKRDRRRSDPRRPRRVRAPRRSGAARRRGGGHARRRRAIRCSHHPRQQRRPRIVAADAALETTGRSSSIRKRRGTR